MAAGLHGQDIADMLIGSLRNLGKFKFSQIAQVLPRYHVMKHWLKKDRVVFGSGYGIRRTLMTELGAEAQHVGLFATDDVDIGDHLKTMVVDWVHLTKNWGFERREVLMNRGASLVNDIIKPRRQAAMIQVAVALENGAWSSPTSTTTDFPWGLPYWIVKNPTQGFNGGAASGHTTVAGVNLTTVPTFKNWTDTYTNVTKADVIKKLRKAFRQTGFVSPVDIQEYRGATQQRIYVNEDTLAEVEDVGEQQNENLGRDIASMDDTIVFKKTPIIWIPQLDADSNDPFYFVDHGTFHPAILKGDYLVETSPEKVGNAHNTFAVHVDLTYQYFCVDRRRNGVVYKNN